VTPRSAVVTRRDRALLTDHAVALVGGRKAPPRWLSAWLAAVGLRGERFGQDEAVLSALLVSRPRAVVLDARDEVAGGGAAAGMLTLCGAIKAQAFTALIPVVMLVRPTAVAEALAAGADEVLSTALRRPEAEARLVALLRRNDRDTDVHPSSRLVGTRAIATVLERRVQDGRPFAAGYVDLDHFKEFNDRYGYHQGDRVIRLLARILHDTVVGVCGAEGFVGHIGGDDFLFVIPLEALPTVADTVVEVFDALIPWQYSDQDRRVGYFLGKDRRGQLHRIPVMTLSIGVVTNQHRRFTRGHEVSELATEMKGYAKTLPGSVWALDRRREGVS
jgi:diguanylate cyclase (GGDEF)-like protein